MTPDLIAALQTHGQLHKGTDLGGVLQWAILHIQNQAGAIEELLDDFEEEHNERLRFEKAARDAKAAIDEALGIGDDGCGDPEQTLDAIACLKDLQKMETPQLRKIHPLDFPIEVFLADLTTRPANIIRAELAGFASYAGTGTFDIEPPFTVRHLCMFSRSEIRKWPNFGRKCLNEVEEMLRARGLQLWENHDERSLRLLREHKEYFK